jgi:hypothetical protein
VQTGSIYESGPGSGEGINHLFAHYDKARADASPDHDGTVFDRRSVYFSVPEVDTLTKLDNRNGSTLLEKLRSAWSGEALTYAWVDRTKHLIIPRHSYRLCMVVGIQPLRAGALLNATDAGTPQRFLWLPVTDPDMPDEKPVTGKPPDIRSIATGWPAMEAQAQEIALPPEAEQFIDCNRLRVARGQSESAIKNHLILCRIKVAIGLALLHACREVTSQFWEMSETVMEVSQVTLARVEAALTRKAEQQNLARGRAEGARAVEMESIRDDANIKRVANWTLGWLRDHDGEGNWSDVRGDLASRDRDFFGAAIERLDNAGQVKVSQGRPKVITLIGSDR